MTPASNVGGKIVIIILWCAFWNTKYEFGSLIPRPLPPPVFDCLHVSDKKKVDSDKGLGPGYWNCLHGFDVCVSVWGEPGKEANIAGCKKCKQEILNTCSQMTASPIEMNSSWRLIRTYSVQWRLHIWNLLPDWNGEHTNGAYLLPWQKFAPFLW